ncbi:MAG: NAD(P)/FAD-dependent oxidoreductase [Deltaproteobacteria bacterium]|nr:NAD(P)/FAD-dependent oxidoreductase [Deltaproteobacteria bacterium]
MKYHAVIIGAGPAGIGAANYLLNHGIKVLIVEKDIKPGNKACGGGLTESALSFIDDDIASCFEHHKKLKVISPYFSAAINSDKSYMAVADRTLWTSKMLARLQDKGADIILGKRCRSINGNTVLVGDESILSEIIIGADGPNSVVRKHLGINSAIGVIAIQLVIKKEHIKGSFDLKNTPSVYFDFNKFLNGYGWIFPVGDSLKIGCGIPLVKNGGKLLNSSFDLWLKDIGIDSSKGRVQGGSIGCKYLGHRRDNIFLAGDAGGFASPVTGEGIGQAIISGEEVAKEATQKNYSSKILKKLSRYHRKTDHILSQPEVGAFILNSAPFFLKSPSFAASVLRRYSSF